jgi:hypothetical protein
MMMFQGRAVSIALLLLLVGAIPFAAAQDICKSETNTFTAKVDLFASELGTFVRINQIYVPMYLHFSRNSL